MHALGPLDMDPVNGLSCVLPSRSFHLLFHSHILPLRANLAFDYPIIEAPDLKMGIVIVIATAIMLVNRIIKSNGNSSSIRKSKSNRKIRSNNRSCMKQI